MKLSKHIRHPINLIVCSYFTFLMLVFNVYASDDSIIIRNANTSRYRLIFDLIEFDKNNNNSIVWRSKSPLILKMVSILSPSVTIRIKPRFDDDKLLFDCNNAGNSVVKIYFCTYRQNQPNNLSIANLSNALAKENFFFGTTPVDYMKIVKRDDNIYDIFLDKNPKELILYKIKPESFELTANIEQCNDTDFCINKFYYSGQGDPFEVKGWMLKDKHYAIKLDNKIITDNQLIIQGNHSQDSMKFKYNHTHNPAPTFDRKIKVTKDMFYIEKSDLAQIYPKSYTFKENINGEPTIQLEFDNPIQLNTEHNIETLSPNNNLSPNNIQPTLQLDTNADFETATQTSESTVPITDITRSYGIQFAQSNKTILFKGYIKDNEWFTQHTQVCAKLKTIKIQEGNQPIGRFQGFQKENYLLSTEDQYNQLLPGNENVIQGEDTKILICLDERVNPGPLRIENRVDLTTANYIHEFRKEDFKFDPSSNIEVDSIQRDSFDENTPYIILRIKNDHGPIQYENCSICFRRTGNWRVELDETTTNEDGVWLPYNNYWKTYLSTFNISFNRSQSERIYGFLYNTNRNFALNLNIPNTNRNDGVKIEIYAQQTDIPKKLNFYINKNVSSRQCVLLNSDHFYFPDDPLMLVRNISYHHNDNPLSPRPTMRLDLERIEIDNYELFFNSPGTYNISKNITQWTRWENDSNYIYAKLENLQVNNNICSGRIANVGNEHSYHISMNRLDMRANIPLYIYINIQDRPELQQPALTFNFNRTINEANHTIPITYDLFTLHDANYQINSFFDINVENEHPSILLSTMRRQSSSSAIKFGILPFSDDRISNDLRNKLNMNIIHGIEQECETKLINRGYPVTVLNTYPDNTVPFSMELIDIPRPTIDHDTTNDPENILRRINANNNNFNVILFGHIEEDLLTRQLVLCIRAFISRLDNDLKQTRLIRIPQTGRIDNNVIDRAVNSMIDSLIGNLPDINTINSLYNTLRTSSISIPQGTITSTTASLDSIDELLSSSIEYTDLTSIYDNNIQNDLYYTTQLFSPINSFIQGEWQNMFTKISIPTNQFYLRVDSTHKTNNDLSKVFYVLKATDQPVNLSTANHLISDANHNIIADIESWKIPTVHELTHIFQFDEYRETNSNTIEDFLPSFNIGENICFWTSNLKNRQNKILWKVLLKYNQINQHTNSLDYDLKYYEIDSNEEAYLLPVAVL